MYVTEKKLKETGLPVGVPVWGMRSPSSGNRISVITSGGCFLCCGNFGVDGPKLRAKMDHQNRGLHF